MGKSCIEMGGQAVIEGVMMKGKNHYATSVRRPDGKIVTQDEKFVSVTKTNKILGLPFIRGVVSLVEMLIIGTKTLSYSAKVATDEEGETESAASGWYMALTMIFAFGFALLLFKLLPVFIAKTVNDLFVNSSSSILFSIIDGVVKIAIFISYLLVISMWSEIKMVFQYHGAEHKSVHCLEDGKPLTVKNVKRYSTVHKRCGTCFILIVLVLSIFVYSFIPNSLNLLWMFGLRVLLLPVIAGISYEILKMSARYPDNIILGAFSAPGVWFQNITTKEPNNKQIEVAITALKRVIALEKH